MSRQGLSLAFSSHWPWPRIRQYIRHLKRTVGVDRYEILFYHNPGKQSLSEVYQRFLDRARFEVVCFLHHDLYFEIPGWGRRILGHFQRETEYSLLSVVGSVSLPEHGVYWEPLNHLLGRISHQVYEKGQNKRWQNHFSGRFPHLLPALVLDGVILAVHKKRLKALLDQRIPGFHFYDISWSLNNFLAGGKNGVMTDIQVRHASLGRPTPAFETCRQVFLSYYAKHLPQNLIPPIFSPQANLILCQTPKISILVLTPSAHLPQTLTALLNSHYPNYQIYLPQVFGEFSALSPKIQALAVGGYHRSSYATGLLAQIPQSDWLLLLDGCVTLAPDALTRLMRIALRQPERLGTLGLRLYTPDQHLLCQGMAFQARLDGEVQLLYQGLFSPYNYQPSLVTGSMGSPAYALLISAQRFQALGGLNEYQSQVPGLELNLRALKAGYQNWVAGDTWGIYHEALQPSPAQQQQFQQALNRFLVLEGQGYRQWGRVRTQAYK